MRTRVLRCFEVIGIDQGLSYFVQSLSFIDIEPGYLSLMASPIFGHASGRAVPPIPTKLILPCVGFISPRPDDSFVGTTLIRCEKVEQAWRADRVSLNNKSSHETPRLRSMPL